MTIEPTTPVRALRTVIVGMIAELIWLLGVLSPYEAYAEQPADAAGVVQPPAGPPAAPLCFDDEQCGPGTKCLLGRCMTREEIEGGAPDDGKQMMVAGGVLLGFSLFSGVLSVPAAETDSGGLMAGMLAISGVTVTLGASFLAAGFHRQDRALKRWVLDSYGGGDDMESIMRWMGWKRYLTGGYLLLAAWAITMNVMFATDIELPEVIPACTSLFVIGLPLAIKGHVYQSRLRTAQRMNSASLEVSLVPVVAPVHKGLVAGVSMTF